MRGGHQGADVLHLHGGRPLENQRGPRARVLVPWDGGFRTRVVLGGAGKDFDRGGRGEQFGHEPEVGTVVLVQPVQAVSPRRRAVRAWVGMLEDVFG